MTVQEEKNYWNSIAESPDVQAAISDPNIKFGDCLNAILEGIDTAKNGTIVEIGSGMGRFVISISAMWQTARVIGVDISKKMNKLAKKTAKNNGAWGNYDFVKCDGRTIPLKDNEADAVYSILVFEHIPNDAKEQYIKEAARVLHQGGIFRFQFVENDQTYGIGRDEITTMCEYAGFEVEKIDSELVQQNWVWVTGYKT